MNKQKVSCYNCNSEESEVYDFENGFRYVRCKGCGLTYLNPRPAENEIVAAHELGVHSGDNEINVTGNYKRSKVIKYVRILHDFIKIQELQDGELNWLDIGCGYGEFIEALNILSSSSIMVRGTEFNKNKIQSCRSRNLNVDCIDLDNHTDQYNFISLLNVYSHLPDPIDFLKTIKKILKPGGNLIIETGHTSHLPAKYHPKPYYAPDHLSFANKEIVESILEKAGFEIIHTKIYRGENFPRIYEIKGMAIQLGRIVLNKGGSWKNFFPKFPNVDMYIRAKLQA